MPTKECGGSRKSTPVRPVNLPPAKHTKGVGPEGTIETSSGEHSTWGMTFPACLSPAGLSESVPGTGSVGGC